NPFELRGRTKLAALRLESRLQPARAFELDDEDAAAAPRRSEGERERDGRPPDATLPDGEQQAAPEQVVGLHASRTGDSSAGASSLRRKTRLTFVPPKPKEFESAVSIFAGRAWFGT